MGATQVLKASRARTVVVHWTGREGVVIKRFHHPGPLQSLRDHSRAYSEYRLLAALRERGVRVPRPIDVRRADGAWEVVMEWVDDAQPLAAMLCPSADGAGVLAPLAGPLGKLLAQVHGAGLDHPDLHPGNVLVDHGRSPWLIDVDKARLRPALREVHAWRDLVSLAAYVRERTCPRFRARFALAWRSSVPRDLGAVLEPGRESLALLERAARMRRRAFVHRSRRRWLRTSSKCVMREEPGALRFLSRGADDAARRLLEGLPPTPPPRGALTCCASRLVVHASSAWPAVRARWCAAARLVEHAIPVLEPLCAVRAAESWAAFRPSSGGPVALRDVLERRPRALGRLLGRLHDRGLDVEALEVEEDGGRLVLAPPPRLARLDPLAPEATAERRLRALGDARPSAPAHDSFVEGYLQAFPVASERARVASAFARAAI